MGGGATGLADGAPLRKPNKFKSRASALGLIGAAFAAALAPAPRWAWLNPRKPKNVASMPGESAASRLAGRTSRGATGAGALDERRGARTGAPSCGSNAGRGPLLRATSGGPGMAAAIWGWG